MLAPVGQHDGLQRARIVQALRCRAEDAPYDVRFAKQVAARCGAHLLRIGGYSCAELGGRRYDEKRYTRFGRVLAARERPDGAAEAALRTSGVGRIADTDAEGTGACLHLLARTEGCVLLTGAGAAVAAAAVLALAGACELPPGDVLRQAAEMLSACGGAREYCAANGLSACEMRTIAKRLH